MGNGTGTARPAEGSCLAEAKVLVAESTAVIALDLEHMLRRLGCAVLGPVASVTEALALLQRERPNAALLEARLQDGDATPVAEILTALGVPFVLATTCSRGELDAPVLRDAPWVSKPYGRDQLRRGLMRLLDQLPHAGSPSNA